MHLNFYSNEFFVMNSEGRRHDVVNLLLYYLKEDLTN